MLNLNTQNNDWKINLDNKKCHLFLYFLYFWNLRLINFLLNKEKKKKEIWKHDRLRSIEKSRDT